MGNVLRPQDRAWASGDEGQGVVDALFRSTVRSEVILTVKPPTHREDSGPRAPP